MSKQSNRGATRQAVGQVFKRIEPNRTDHGDFGGLTPLEAWEKRRRGGRPRGSKLSLAFRARRAQSRGSKLLTLRGDDIDELVDVLTFMENIGAEDVAVARLKSTLREIATIATMATEE